MLGVELTSFVIPTCLVEDFCGIHEIKYESNFDYSVPNCVDKLYNNDSTRHGCFEDINVASSFSFFAKPYVKYIDPTFMDRLRKGSR
jgi:hypothetical protein